MVLIVISVRIVTTVNPKRCSEMRGLGGMCFWHPRGDSAATGTETPTTSTEMRQLFQQVLRPSRGKLAILGEFDSLPSNCHGCLGGDS